MPDFNGYEVCFQINTFLNRYNKTKEFTISIISWHTEIKMIIEDVDAKHIVDFVSEKPLTTKKAAQVLKPCA